MEFEEIWHKAIKAQRILEAKEKMYIYFTSFYNQYLACARGKRQCSNECKAENCPYCQQKQNISVQKIEQTNGSVST